MTTYADLLAAMGMDEADERVAGGDLLAEFLRTISSNPTDTADVLRFLAGRAPDPIGEVAYQVGRIADVVEQPGELATAAGPALEMLQAMGSGPLGALLR